MKTSPCSIGATVVALLSPLAAAAAQPLVAPIGTAAMSGSGGDFAWDENKFRLLVCLDRSQLPWGDRAFTIQTIRLRRSSGIIYGLDTHTKTSSIILSTGGTSPLAINQLTQPVLFDAQHGANRTPFAAREVSFPCRSRLDGSWMLEPFAVAYDLGSGFTVTREVPNLVIEFQVTRNPMTPGQQTNSEDWPVDAERIGTLTNPNGERGQARLIGDSCPARTENCGAGVYRKGDLATLGLSVGRFFQLAFASDSPNTCGCVGLGSLRSQPMVLANGCRLYVDPVAVLVVETSSNGIMEVFGQVPNLADLAGTRVGCQFAVTGPWPEGFGTSAALELTIGAGRSRLDQLAALWAATDSVSPLPENGVVNESVPVMEFVGN